MFGLCFLSPVLVLLQLLLLLLQLLLESRLCELVLHGSMTRAWCYKNKGAESHQMLTLTLLNTTSVTLANLSPGSSGRPCPVWCSGWEVVFVNAATAGRYPPSQHCRRLDHVWPSVGGKHHWGNACRGKENGRGPTGILCLVLVCYLPFSHFFVYGTN